MTDKDQETAQKRGGRTWWRRGHWDWESLAASGEQSRRAATVACYAATVAAPELALRAPHGPVSTDLRARTLLDGAAKRQREIRVGQGRAGRKPGPRPSSTRFVALICAPQAYSFLRERCPSRAPGETLAGIISSSLRLLLHGGRIDAATTVLCAWLDRETSDILLLPLPLPLPATESEKRPLFTRLTVGGAQASPMSALEGFSKTHRRF
jgi:hypothetical protein